jgi:uncharacterized membrane protein (UPF0127 family)
MIVCAFETSAGVALLFAELARSAGELARGLQGRTWLPANEGMLLVFEWPQVIKLWMHQTLIPLDMIFVDAAGRVAWIEENAEPLTLAPRGPDTPTQFVIEVSAGWARAHGVELGARLHCFPFRALLEDLFHA